jgi:hypothetical protein
MEERECITDVDMRTMNSFTNTTRTEVGFLFCIFLLTRLSPFPHPIYVCTNRAAEEILGMIYMNGHHEKFNFAKERFET